MTKEKTVKKHYSRSGYNGDFTYTSVCGKKVKTHQDTEDSTVHPEKANCKKCLQTAEYKKDIAKCPVDIKNRIYIESDILQADEFRSAQRDVVDLITAKGLKYVDRVFSKVLDKAWHDLETTWKAVKEADEIYATSSLIPLSGGSYMGAPVIFNGMCERAVKEGIKGKSVYILNTLKNINWYMIKLDVMQKAFTDNDLYMWDEDYDKMVKIDVSKVKK